MALFIYKAKAEDGSTAKGEREARDKYELYRLLKAEGLETVNASEKGAAGSSFGKFNLKFGGNVKTQDKINFANNLGSMIQAGLPLSRALSVIERQSKSAALKAILVDIQENISKGQTLSQSLAVYPKVFSRLFISMVHAGEESGTIADSLKTVGMQMDKSYALTRRVRGALIYPAVIIGAMAIIGVVMLTYVIPTLLKTFSDLHVTLPLSTQIVMAVSNAFSSHPLYLLAGIAAVSVALYYASRTNGGKRFFQKVLLKIPVIGGIAVEVNTARSARTLSSLLSSGVEVVEATKITADVVQNLYFRDVLLKAGDVVEKGESLGKVFGESKLYPVFMAEMMSVGEETGKTSDMLLAVANFYESDVEDKTKNMSTIIEPVLMILIGAAVGFFAISMISPMYSLVNVIH